jgi:RNA polymerase sigma factor (sigma-70 family)
MNELLTLQLADDLDGAFEALVRTHQDRLYSLALRYTNRPADAEDLTQEAFVRAYRALAGYGAARIRALELRGWLTTILLNLCRNHAQRPERRVPNVAVDIADFEKLASEGRHDPEAHAERREAAERWAALVATLPPRYRAAVLLRHLDGLSYQEMTAILGLPEGTLKAQVHRGLALLRAAFEADERTRHQRGPASERRLAPILSSPARALS